ncbi:Protein of uncharacterised function (DUF2637) (plasmid) [Tsukamurella tyrosinosolvens]|uniref:Homeodomain-like domain-containing protein n=1 Tax=Tsukamurella tyrosinosolvens TaxID=57704 RepID=A0A1H4UXM3_TSUTY|nr:helix-turn-helix domain-containing protein [Tsukamurella tyrosinosolvens]KXO98407.1 hypothetical protein AXK58_25375 [Tsukamurella tyrosinosolvens]SEC73158.1 Homeodomain-like domain-containing protein [Tsukamurella tyrosinosolvens]VEH90833.1 Protein of uncharacterised function (DUF2637) [Tsukamurella tyrosinosolvens]
MAEQHAHLARTRRLLWTLLVFATVTSLAGNITHSTGMQPAVGAALGPILAAALAPVALLGLTHLLGMWSRISSRGVTYWCFMAAIVAINAAAFRLSFDALRSLAMQYGYGRGDAALFPLILDGLVAVCTLGLVTLSRIEATQKAAEAPAHDAGDAPLTRRDARDGAQVDAADALLDAGAAPRPAPDAAMVPADDADDALSITSLMQTREIETRSRPLVPPGEGPDARDAAAADAAELIASGRVKVDPAVVQSVLERTAAGAPSRVVAGEVGVSPSTVQRIVKAARESGLVGADER